MEVCVCMCVCVPIFTATEYQNTQSANKARACLQSGAISSGL